MALNPNVVREQNAALSELVHTPTFLVVAGALPGLFVATSLTDGAIIGVAVAVSILCAWALSRLVPRFADGLSRVPVALMLNATVMVLVSFGVRVADPVAYQAMGMYLPLACVGGMASLFVAQGCVVTDELAEGDRPLTVGDAMFSAVCTLATLAFIGLVNEMLSTGVVFGLTMNELAASPIAIFGTPAGSLLVLALVAAFVQACDDVRAKAAADAATPKGGER